MEFNSADLILRSPSEARASRRMARGTIPLGAVLRDGPSGLLRTTRRVSFSDCEMAIVHELDDVATADAEPSPVRTRARVASFWYPYLLIAPTMLTLTVVSLIPF